MMVNDVSGGAGVISGLNIRTVKIDRDNFIKMYSTDKDSMERRDNFFKDIENKMKIEKLENGVKRVTFL